MLARLEQAQREQAQKGRVQVALNLLALVRALLFRREGWPVAFADG